LCADSTKVASTVQDEEVVEQGVAIQPLKSKPHGLNTVTNKQKCRLTVLEDVFKVVWRYPDTSTHIPSTFDLFTLEAFDDSLAALTLRGVVHEMF
jgi:hypothetical protein